MKRSLKAHLASSVSGSLKKIAIAAAAVLLSSAALCAQDLPQHPLPSREVIAALANSQEAPPAPQTASPNGSAPISLTLQHAIQLALQNSKDIQLAKIQTGLADRSADITRAQFLPNLYAGSGAGYTFGIPETPGGRAPSIFSLTYTQEVFNEPLRGQAKELQEQANAQRVALTEVRNGVIAKTAMAYLEIAKVRHSLTLLRGESESADKILDVTRQRQDEGFELPVEITKAQLTRAQVLQKVLQLEGREDELQVFLKSQLGLSDDQEIEVTAEDLPGEADQQGANLVALALENNTGLQLAQSDVRAREFRLKGEKRGYFPTLQLVGIYSVLGKYNNFQEFFNHFERNNLNAGINVQVPLFSAKTKANIGLATVNLEAAKATLANRKTQVTADVRQKSRLVREKDAAKEVARLELQLAQQNVEVLQSQFGEGRINLREVERARVTENDRWMDFLDANFARQQAELELLQTAGQLDKVWQ
ncbi:MAG TPA: TolC family protein [Candidatus Dormibacteraeota bacterium]|nr:TolC family protein [Candidatus Dormibacteraeota bacterium]